MPMRLNGALDISCFEFALRGGRSRGQMLKARGDCGEQA
jgi:hypothetical protein